MKLAFSCERRHLCLLCGYEFTDEEEDLGRKRLLEHLRNVHHRTMVSGSERQGKVKAVDWNGPRWANEE